MNPAAAGMRADVEGGATYRNQWTGFAGAPVTMGASVTGRLYKNKMAVGGFVFQDKIGPYNWLSAALAYAFRIKFDDVALSIGLNGSYNSQGVNVGSLSYQDTHDQTMLNIYNNPKATNFNAAGGAMLYNDRFFISLSANNLAGSNFNYDKVAKRYGEYRTVQHYCFALGYNWSANPDFVWENNLMAVYVGGVPPLLDYYLRLHIKNAFFFGAGYRFGVAVVAQAGYTFENTFQVAYSYDYNTNKLSTISNGSHELKLVYLFNKTQLKHGRGLGEFKHQRYQYML